MIRENDSKEDRARVKARITTLIREYYNPGIEFRMSDLTQFVTSRFGGYVAPDSPGRIMRLLKQDGEINYTLISRSGSLYRWEIK